MLYFVCYTVYIWKFYKQIILQGLTHVFPCKGKHKYKWIPDIKV